MGKFYPSWSLFFDNRFETTGHGLLHDPLIQNLATMYSRKSGKNPWRLGTLRACSSTTMYPLENSRAKTRLWHLINFHRDLPERFSQRVSKRIWNLHENDLEVPGFKGLAGSDGWIWLNMDFLGSEVFPFQTMATSGFFLGGSPQDL